MVKIKKIDNAERISLPTEWTGPVMVIVFVGDGTVVGKEISQSFGSGSIYCFKGGGAHLSINGRIKKGYVLWFDQRFFDHFKISFSLARPAEVFEDNVFSLEMDAYKTQILKREVKLMKAELDLGVNIERLRLLFSLVMLTIFEEYLLYDRVDLQNYLKRDFTNLLEGNFRVHRDTVFYAKHLAISPRKLNELCRGWFNGMDLFRVVMERICLEAELMLMQPNVVIKTVAYELGFSSTNHFRIYFKKFRGITPSDFREAIN